MRLERLAGGAIAALALTAGAALAEWHGNDLVHAREYQGILYMMNRQHMSLYTYDGDEPGVSNCTGACAENWPPATLPAGTEMPENYSLIAREDGRMQIAHDGRPLYRYSGDRRVGDRRGDGIDGVWRLATP